MSTDESGGSRVLMLGSDSVFSGVVLRGLLDADIEVCAFVVYDPHPVSRGFEPTAAEIPVVVGGTGPAVAVERAVPVQRVASMHDARVLEQAGGRAPDVLLVACFPMLLGDAWLTLPKEMCLNLHPSILPSYRGPTPLFWQLREGEHETGITLHFMERAVDAGAIVGQSTMSLAPGARFSEINTELAEMGVQLVVDTLDRLSTGIPVPRTPQDERLASYQPFPKETDFRFDTHFSAERAFRFIEGTREWGQPYEVDVGDTVLVVERALDYHDDARMTVPFEIDADRIKIRLSEGVLEARGHLAVPERD